jgi:transposase-like protein
MHNHVYNIYQGGSMDPVKLAEAVQMFDSGMTVAAIAEELEMSTQTIRLGLKGSGRSLVKPSIHLADEKVVVEAYQNDEPIPTIMEQYGLTYTTLYSILRRHNVPTRKVASAPAQADRLKVAIEMYQRNVVLWKIKQETGIAQPTLHNELHRLGIPLRRQRMEV